MSIHSKRTRRPVTVAMVVAVAILLLTACSNAYDPAHAFYGPTDPTVTPPHLVSITTTISDPANDYVGCAFGVTAIGVGAIVTIAAPPVGLVAWIGYGAATSAGIADSLYACYQDYNANLSYFHTYTYCQGLPLLHATPSEYGGMGADVEFPSCTCGGLCMLWSGHAETVWRDSHTYYHDGQNRVNGPATDPPPPIDYNALAASMGVGYGGCVDYYNRPSLCS
jgi:hypothetical protein